MLILRIMKVMMTMMIEDDLERKPVAEHNNSGRLQCFGGARRPLGF